MAFLGGLLGGQAQAPGTAQAQGLLGGVGNFFSQQQQQNPALLRGVAGALMNGGNVPAAMSQAEAEQLKKWETEQQVQLRQQALAQAQAQFGQSYGLQSQEFGLKRDALASEAQQRRAQQNATADFLEKNGADPGLVAMARSGLGSEAFKAYQTGKGAGTEYGLNPVYGLDANGNTVIGQVGKDGTVIPSKVPEGFQPLSPYGLTQQKAAGTATGKAQGEAGSMLPSAIATAQTVDQQIKDLKTDPYLPRMLGPINSRLGNYSSDAARVQSKIDQLQGGAFLQARQLLKGGGAITDYEGQKAEQALVRLNQAQTVEDFNSALDEFNGYVQQGVAKLQASAGGRGATPPGGSSLKQKYGLE